uniref:Uncharacterized protein n=1 Tax=Arundo donax TaxID=35708 RepID=A0A0A9DDB0_ARUDO
MPRVKVQTKCTRCHGRAEECYFDERVQPLICLIYFYFINLIRFV